MVLFSLFSGRVLSVAWSADAKLIFSGSSDGYVLILWLVLSYRSMCDFDYAPLSKLHA